MCIYEITHIANIQKTIDTADIEDVVYLRGGIYQQQVVVKNRKSIAIMAPGETPILDGTVAIGDIAQGGWIHYRDGIYQRIINLDIWQLFLENDLINVGRWPDANFKDGSIWSRECSMKQ